MKRGKIPLFYFSNRLPNCTRGDGKEEVYFYFCLKIFNF